MGRLWHWLMLLVSGAGAIVAFRLAYMFLETAEEDATSWIWYVALAVVSVGGLYLLWQMVVCIRRLRAPP
ncbi:MAG: hypothetical protein AAF414_12420 [Pseudomonadota bacterium]